MVNTACPACSLSLDSNVVENAVMRAPHALPHCDGCGTMWPGAFVASALSTDALKRVRGSRRGVATQMAQSVLPALLPLMRWYGLSRVFLEESETLSREMLHVQDERDDVKRLLVTANKETAVISAKIMAVEEGGGTAGAVSEGFCTRLGCNGALVSGECVVCFAKTCSRCGETEVGGRMHQCSVSAVLTRSLIAQQTRPCPRCSVPISRIEGCAQMYCVRCKTKFNWDTGNVYSSTSFFDNPHFFEEKTLASSGHDPRVDTAERLCWHKTLERGRGRVGSSRAARVLFCIAVRQTMHLAELLGPATAPAWRSPFAPNGDPRALNTALWQHDDLAPGDQPGCVSCDGGVRRRATLTTLRRAFASKEISEATFMSRLEQHERREWQFTEAVKALAGHAAGVAQVVDDWFADNNKAYAAAHAAEYATTLSTKAKDARLLAASLADREMLNELAAVADRTVNSLAGMHSLRSRAGVLLRYDATVDYDVRLEREGPQACQNRKGCKRHEFRPQQWLINIKQTRDQLRDTAAVVDLVAQPRGHDVTICFDAVYAMAFSRTAPVLLGRPLYVGLPVNTCDCTKCSDVIAFDLQRRHAKTPAETAEIDKAENAATKGRWDCHDDNRGIATREHRFP